MGPKTVTAITIAALTILGALLVWDVYLALDGRRGNTISARVRALDRKFGGLKIIIPFLIGLLFGHWWL